jgi:hypothetical protein
VGRDVAVYPLVAAAICLVALAVRRRHPASSRALVGAGLVIGVLPLLLGPVRDRLVEAHEQVWGRLGLDGFAGVLAPAPPEIWQLSDATGSWFGPLTFLVAGGSIAMTVAAARRGRLGAAAVAVSAGLPLGLLTLAVTLAYDPWRGRFLVYGMALTCATVGLLLERRALAWGAAVLGVVTLALSLTFFLGKPSGIRLVERGDGSAPESSIWGEPRWRVQSALRGSEGPILHAVEQQVPADATIAVAGGVNEFLSPYFGPTLERIVHLVRPDGGQVPEDVAWLVMSPAVHVSICRRAWRTVVETEAGYLLARRVPGAGCATGGRETVATSAGEEG